MSGQTKPIKPSTVDFVSAMQAALSTETSTVEVVETHISWVFLTDKWAYKVKKPLKNDFLDFSTLDKRQYYCEEELRLDRRYADELYVDVLPISQEGESLQIGAGGKPCEWAVRMQRFPSDDVLSQRLKNSQVSTAEMAGFAQSLAAFHQTAARASSQTAFGDVPRIRQDALDNLTALQGQVASDQLTRLQVWTESTFQALHPVFLARREQGFIRECHGDLHAGNIVRWQGRLVPFDGIEFNEHFRWIDILSDAAFLAMDLLKFGRDELSHVFVNSYLESSGDYHGVPVLRWYMVYRALVRAKVSGLVLQQHTRDSAEYREAQIDLARDMELAEALTLQSSMDRDDGRQASHTADPIGGRSEGSGRVPYPRGLWITHGVSGSGKSTAALQIVEQRGAIRLRSDVERKRLWGKEADFRADAAARRQLYSADMSERTYQQLQELSQVILAAGYSVIIDATCLKRQQRQRFQRVAHQLQVPFYIIHCQADLAILQERLASRQAAGGDASDADAIILQQQLAELDVLEPEEQKFVVDIDTDQRKGPKR